MYMSDMSDAKIIRHGPILLISQAYTGYVGSKSFFALCYYEKTKISSYPQNIRHIRHELIFQCDSTCLSMSDHPTWIRYGSDMSDPASLQNWGHFVSVPTILHEFANFEITVIDHRYCTIRDSTVTVDVHRISTRN